MKARTWSTLLALLLLALPVTAVTPAAPAAPASAETLVFAAASLSDALTEIGKAYEGGGGGKVSFNFAASNDLARQIDVLPLWFQGPPRLRAPLPRRSRGGAGRGLRQGLADARGGLGADRAQGRAGPGRPGCSGGGGGEHPRGDRLCDRRHQLGQGEGGPAGSGGGHSRPALLRRADRPRLAGRG